MKFNEKLLELRKMSGLSQEELGEKIEVSRQTISKWEIGKSTPELDKLVLLSEIFNISLDELVKDVENSKDNTKDIRKKFKLNKYAVFILGIFLLILILIYSFKYLNIKKFTINYNNSIENFKKTGGMIKISIANEKTIEGRIYYFKDEIERIEYLKTDKIGNNTYIYKIEYLDKNNIYTIDENNKTYTIESRTSWAENYSLSEIDKNIKTNIIPNSYFFRFSILFNKNYHIKNKRNKNNFYETVITKGDSSKDPYVRSVSIFPDLKELLYIETFFKTSDRTKSYSISYLITDIGKTLDNYLKLPDLSNYILIENTN